MERQQKQEMIGSTCEARVEDIFSRRVELLVLMWMLKAFGFSGDGGSRVLSKEDTGHTVKYDCGVDMPGFVT